MKNVITLLVATTASVTFGAEMQFVCNYGSQVVVAGSDIEKPTVDIKKTKSKFAFYVDYRGNKAEYVNLLHGVKSPLALTGSSPSMVVLTETADGDNHFTATIFLQRSADGTFPSVLSQHSWAEPAAYYRPSMRLGFCAER